MLAQELRPSNNIINRNKAMEIPFYPEVPLYDFVNVITIQKRKFLFRSVPQTYNIYKRSSVNHLLEKYKIGFNQDNPVTTFWLKIYKDSVYIVDLKINSDVDFTQMLENIVQIASERALEMTTRKEVRVNVAPSLFSKVDRYKACDFESEEEQTEFEKKSLGEALILKVLKSNKFMKRIKKNPILI